jgi:hypothetical protein
LAADEICDEPRLQENFQAAECCSGLWTGWGNQSNNGSSGEYLEEVAKRRQRLSIRFLECGSGPTTILLALFADRRGVGVVCDGPPQKTTPGDRYGLVPRMRDHLGGGSVILFDEVQTQDPDPILSQWLQET